MLPFLSFSFQRLPVCSVSRGLEADLHGLRIQGGRKLPPPVLRRRSSTKGGDQEGLCGLSRTPSCEEPAEARARVAVAYVVWCRRHQEPEISARVIQEDSLWRLLGRRHMLLNVIELSLVRRQPATSKANSLWHVCEAEICNSQTWDRPKTAGASFPPLNRTCRRAAVGSSRRLGWAAPTASPDPGSVGCQTAYGFPTRWTFARRLRMWRCSASASRRKMR